MERTVWADQLLLAKFNGQARQLPVRLEIHKDRVLLAGFSSWGTRLFSLSYDGAEIQTDILPGLTQTLPPARRVLIDMMLALWPAEAWQSSLTAMGWRLRQSNEDRQLHDASGRLLMEIRYAQAEPLAGDMLLRNFISGYEMTIKTLRWGHDVSKEFP